MRHPQAHGAQTCWNQKAEDADSSPPHHPVRGGSTPAWNHGSTTAHYPHQGGTHGVEGINPPWPRLPGKAIKLCFSTSPKTLSPRINFVSSTEARVGFTTEAVTGPTGWSLSRSTSRAVPLKAGYVLRDCCRVLSHICVSTIALRIQGREDVFQR